LIFFYSVRGRLRQLAAGSWQLAGSMGQGTGDKGQGVVGLVAGGGVGLAPRQLGGCDSVRVAFCFYASFLRFFLSSFLLQEVGVWEGDIVVRGVKGQGRKRGCCGQV
jgi:hypothetical protein